MSKIKVKNPTAVLIGQRIKQACLMAGLETLAKMNEDNCAKLLKIARIFLQVDYGAMKIKPHIALLH